ncbi:MAG: MiaB/RimO family radical SAM methylthiotransferase, partial [Desulfuromonadales bacterium]|nr:MiaB/RimO family radical SAM methylthiotransferase [Desulfuromonadales bacterium]NIS40620.1 MiaB/RimO family radical SAM methylthiotransferase [Desulfuromonadales bacterium]
ISRPADEIVAEVEALAAQGVKEVTLLGQNVNSYGLKGDGTASFADLLRRVHAVEGVERLRFTTSHPKDISDELIDCFRDLDKLCKHMHLPVQSGSSRVLEAMNRGYDREQYLEKVRRLRQACPDIRLTTDIIVGFPGETEGDFEQTLSLVEEVGYADAFLFLYSPRPGTAAADLEDTSTAAEKQERFDRLLKVQHALSDHTWGGDVGRELPVLVEGESKAGQGQIFGRTTWNRIVNFHADSSLAGRIVNVRISKNFRNSQLGVLID